MIRFSRLRIQNFALIEDQTLNLSEHLNVISGETGAGKSLVFRAIESLIDHSNTKKKIRTGTNQATIELELELDNKETNGAFKRIFQKILPIDGKVKTLIDGKNVPMSDFADALLPFLDFCYQNNQIKLIEPNFQIEMFDKTVGINPLSFHHKFTKSRNLLKKFEEDFSPQKERAFSDLDYLTFQSQELIKFKPSGPEFVELEKKIQWLSNAQAIQLTLAEMRSILSEQDPSLANAGLLLSRKATRLADLLPEAQKVVIETEKLVEQVESLCSAIVAVSNCMPEALDEAESLLSRHEQYLKLARKHRIEPEGLEAFALNLQRQIEELGTYEERKQDALKEILDSCRDLLQSAWDLHLQRLKHSKSFLLKINSELPLLGFQNAELAFHWLPFLSLKKMIFLLDPLWESCQTLECFSVITQASEKYWLSALEKTSVSDLAEWISSFNDAGFKGYELLFRANLGEKFLALRDTASGGELSRLLLLLKSTERPSPTPPILLFDEIDSGLGGNTASLIADKLKSIAKNCQVLVISHSAPIAASGNIHWKAEKSVSNERTITNFNLLDKKSRIREISRMLGGNQRTAMQHAEAML